VHAGCYWRNLIVRGHLHNLGVDGTMVLKWVKKYVGIEPIDLSEDRDRLWAFVKRVTNIRVL
jgi:hypothetical protein